jgi:2-polyprenyl-6-hydroxyphenyl methylase / 3-demethylubiquinone-9 3-methyltransferase
METIATRPKVNNEIYNTYGDRWYEADDDPVALLRAESKTKTPWILDKIATQGFLSPSTKILDVGCGAGFLSNELAKQKMQVTGVDLSEESLCVAAKYDDTKSVHYQTADAYRLPFDDASFEVVTAMDFLEHVDRPGDVILEFSRVLKPGGLFIFHTFNRNPLAHLIIIKVVELIVKNTPKHMHVIDLFIKPKELKNFCLSAGMETKEMTGIKPVFSTIPIRNIFTGIVPKSLRFELTSSLLLSYMGYAVKNK